MDYSGSNPIVPLFLLKTFSILEHSDPTIITWSEPGDSFIVIDPDRFGAEVIPIHFKHNKFSSFVRQLNFYGFRKVKGTLNVVGESEQHSWEFRHPFFLRGQPDVLAEIKRYKSSHAAGSVIEDHSIGSDSGSNSSARTGESVEQMRLRIATITSKLEVLSKSVTKMQVTIAAQCQAGLEEEGKELCSSLSLLETDAASTTRADEFNTSAMLPSVVVDDCDCSDVSTVTAASAMDWDIGDDELLRTFLGDLNDPYAACSPAAPEQRKRGAQCGDTGCEPLSLKRARSIEDFAELLIEPVRQVAKTGNAAPNTFSIGAADLNPTSVFGEPVMSFSHPIIAQAVASAVALNEQHVNNNTEVCYNEYVDAVAAILSCAGMSRAQALATSTAVLSQTQPDNGKLERSSISAEGIAV